MLKQLFFRYWSSTRMISSNYSKMSTLCLVGEKHALSNEAAEGTQSVSPGGLQALFCFCLCIYLSFFIHCYWR